MQSQNLLKKMGFLIGVFASTSLFSHSNLEDNIQDYVLDTKQIIIPEFPDAFNPSIVRWKNMLLMSFRNLAHLETKSMGNLPGYTSSIGIVIMDDDFNPIGDAQLIDLSSSCDSVQGREEDGRLVVVGEKLFLVYSDNKDMELSEGGFRVCMAELSFDGYTFTCKSNEMFKDFEGVNECRREKNWTPFDYNGELHFTYTLNPLIALKPIQGTGYCKTISKTYQRLPWKWGDPRGGTPAVKINENEYITFFHSLRRMSTEHSCGDNIDHYFLGACKFSAQPPFKLTGISVDPIVGPCFYSGESYDYYWRPVVVVFPCGIIQDKKCFWVSYGRQDHEMWVVKIDKDALLDSLKQINLR